MLPPPLAFLRRSGAPLLHQALTALEHAQGGPLAPEATVSASLATDANGGPLFGADGSGATAGSTGGPTSATKAGKGGFMGGIQRIVKDKVKQISQIMPGSKESGKSPVHEVSACGRVAGSMEHGGQGCGWCRGGAGESGSRWVGPRFRATLWQ